MIARLKHLADTYRASIRAYLSMIGGSVGRLVLSLVYFIAVANTLSISEFGLFATASACGIMLSRLMAFGFVSPLYRIATVKRRLLGVYTAGFLGGLGLSLPVIALAAWATYWLVFNDQMALATFAKIIVAEVLCWRIMEIVVIVSYGVNRFGAGILAGGGGNRPEGPRRPSLCLARRWFACRLGWYYIGANGLAALLAVVFFYPRVRLRWKPALYIRRWVDAVSVAGAEMLFYVQSELDKVLVLSLGGAEAAGIYAMIMRLVDLTALPVRAFLTLLTQRLMRTATLLESLKTRILLEGGVAAISTAGLAGNGGISVVLSQCAGQERGGGCADAHPCGAWFRHSAISSSIIRNCSMPPAAP
jgi:O-antigen/teichoic acid export membrane protein